MTSQEFVDKIPGLSSEERSVLYVYSTEALDHACKAMARMPDIRSKFAFLNKVASNFTARGPSFSKTSPINATNTPKIQAYKPEVKRFTREQSLEQARVIAEDLEGLANLSRAVGKEWAEKFRDRVVANHLNNLI